jgi:hypothetical protein
MLLELDLARHGHEQAPPRVVRLPTAWRVVRRVRGVVDGVLASHPESIRQSARLVASELMENVIKYGEVLPDGSPPIVCVQQSAGVLTIRSRNGVAEAQDVQRIFDILQRLRTRKDVQSVYIEAIVQAMAARGKSAALGLLRIAAEATFELDARFEDGVLEIIARKVTS